MDLYLEVIDIGELTIRDEAPNMFSYSRYAVRNHSPLRTKLSSHIGEHSYSPIPNAISPIDLRNLSQGSMGISSTHSGTSVQPLSSYVFNSRLLTSTACAVISGTPNRRRG
jgi:hypothetical protein